MDEINKTFILNNINEIKAFCEGRDVEYLLHIKTNENFIMWHMLDEMSLSNIIGTKLHTNCKLRIKQKKKFVYVNNWIEMNGDQGFSTHNSTEMAISRIAKEFDYLSIAVKTEVDDE